MFNELTTQVSEFYKCDCLDIFFDVLSTELNLEGVVYFYQHTLAQVVEIIEKHFQPAELSLLEASASSRLEPSISNVLRKKYQSNWRKILNKVISNEVCNGIMQSV